MVTVSAFQNQLRRFFLRETPIATDVAVIPPDDGENSETISYYWDAAYVPEGYVLDYTDISDLDTLLVYKNGDNEYFQISTMSLNGTPSIDTEDFIKQEIEIGDGSGYLYTTLDDSNIRLLLLYEDCVLFIEGKVSQKEVLKIAETLYKVSLA